MSYFCKELCLLTGANSGDSCFHPFPYTPAGVLISELYSFFNAAHQPARGETSVCGENLPIQVFEVFGGKV